MSWWNLRASRNFFKRSSVDSFPCIVAVAWLPLSCSVFRCESGFSRHCLGAHFCLGLLHFMPEVNREPIAKIPSEAKTRQTQEWTAGAEGIAHGSAPSTTFLLNAAGRTRFALLLGLLDHRCRSSRLQQASNLVGRPRSVSASASFSVRLDFVNREPSFLAILICRAQRRPLGFVQLIYLAFAK